MGGSVNVAIRLNDGRSYCQTRWTNNTPYWLKNVKTFAGNKEHLLAYIDMARENVKSDGVGGPARLQNCEYGLIVIDCFTNTILDNNTYSTFNHYNPIQTSPIEMKENGFIEFANAGMISQEISYIRDKQIVNKKVIKLSPEEAILVGEKEHEICLERTRDHVTSFLIDTHPMKYIKFDRNDWKSYKAKLLDIGFPMNKKQGLNQYLKYVGENLVRIA